MDGNFLKIRKVLIYVLFLNIAVAVSKVIVGLMANSNSILADGYHSLSDGSSNIVGLIGIWLAAKPVDKSHPYGHKKFETFFGMLIGLVLLILSFEIFSSAIPRLANPVMPNLSIPSFIVMIITLLVNIAVTTYELREGRKLHSDILVSDATHTKTDILISISVIISMILIKLGIAPIIDPIISIIISIIIVAAALEIIKPSANILLDNEAIDCNKIKEVVMSLPDVIDCHKIRSRGRADDINIDLHVLIEPTKTILEAHNLSHLIQNKLREHFGATLQSIVHVEPYIKKVAE